MAGEKVTTFKIYVGDVPDGTTSDEIRQIFEEFGTVVECDCLGNRAFVHMEDDIEGKHAVGQLQDRELQGTKLKILESKNNVPPKTPVVKLLVKNIASSVDARGLRNMFKRFGFVLEVELLNGEGHVCLEATGDIGSAIKEMNGKVIDNLALTVEPAPIQPAPAVEQEQESSSSSPMKKKFKSPRKYNGDNNGRSYNAYQHHQTHWSNPNTSEYQGQGEWYEDEDYNNYSEPYSREVYFPPPPRQRFHAPPERILRDPYGHQSRGGNPRYRGPPPMGMRSRGPPQPLFFRPPQAPRMGGRAPFMRPRMPPQGHFSAPFSGRSQADDSFYKHSGVVARNGPPPVSDRYQEQAEVFYEDEPLPSLIPRSSIHPPRMNVSGSNMIPLGGGGGMDYEEPAPGFPRRGQFGKRGGGRGRGRGKPQKFTALQEEVSPGEKYPVPPIYNPNFRAPNKWQNEGPKRKVKKKKAALIPAELPNYSRPVPDLPNNTVPKGAIFKPFPTPFEHNGIGSQIDNGSSGSANFSQRNEMDFTMDDFV